MPLLTCGGLPTFSQPETMTMRKPKLAKPKRPEHLPQKPSKLIRRALQDLEAVERSPKYSVHMGFYHSPRAIDDACAVCFAGAVIARAGNKTNRWLDPDQFPPATRAKLYALDQFRRGHVAEGIFKLLAYPEDVPIDARADMHVPEYDANPAGFKSALREMATRLEGFKL